MPKEPAYKLYRLSRLRLARNRIDAAIEYARQGLAVVERDSLRWRLRHALAIALKADGRVEEAIEQYAENMREGAPARLSEERIKEFRTVLLENSSEDEPVIPEPDEPDQAIPIFSAPQGATSEGSMTHQQSASSRNEPRNSQGPLEDGRTDSQGPWVRITIVVVTILMVFGYTFHVRIMDASSRFAPDSTNETTAETASSSHGVQQAYNNHAQPPRGSAANRGQNDTPAARMARIKRLFNSALQKKEQGITFPTKYADRELIGFFWRTPSDQGNWSSFKERWPTIKQSLRYVPAFGLDNDDIVRIWPLRRDAHDVPRGETWERATHLGVLVTRVDPWDEESQLWVMPFD